MRKYRVVTKYKGVSHWYEIERKIWFMWITVRHGITLSPIFFENEQIAIDYVNTKEQ